MAVYDKTYYLRNTATRFSQKLGRVGTNGDRQRNNYYLKREATSTNGRWPAVDYGSLGWQTPDEMDLLYNKAIAKFTDEIGSRASNLTGLMEINSSLDMITKRGLQLAKAAREVRQLRFASAARTLSIPDDVKRDVIGRASKKHLFSGMWLEYWLGWAPMIGDIYTSIDVLQRPFPSDMIQVRASGTRNFATGDTSKTWYNQVPGYVTLKRNYHEGVTRCDVTLYGKVEVVNSNLFLASQLGLTNPALTAWDLVPFSFVVNWFTPVSAFLAGMDLAPGIRIVDPGRTIKFSQSSVAGDQDVEFYNCLPSGRCKHQIVGEKSNIKMVEFQRQPGAHPRVKLTRPRIPRMNWTRAATSISLLTQLFLKP